MANPELLKAAAATIKGIRRENEILSARLEGYHLIRRLLDLSGRDGCNVLGGIGGDIADRLEAAAEEATRAPESAPPQPGIMPKFVCHKTLEAMKIADLVVEDDGEMFFVGLDGTRIPTTEEWMRKHDMQPTDAPDSLLGYWVRYDTGYTSWSPTDAFERGYSPAPTDDPAASTTSSEAAAQP